MVGLGPIWPASRTQLNGVSLGDAWPCTTMPQSSSQPWESIVPFHKLTQWLCYSLMVPIERMIGANFIHGELLTGLPEYRNGGLLIDTGLLTLKEADKVRGEAAFQDYQSQKGTPCVEVVPAFAPHDDVIVEWRAVTVGYLDEIHKKVCEELGVTLNLAQVLEAGTWKVCHFMMELRTGALTTFTGRKRDCCSVETKHKRAADRDHFGWYCILAFSVIEMGREEQNTCITKGWRPFDKCDNNKSMALCELSWCQQAGREPSTWTFHEQAHLAFLTH